MRGAGTRLLRRSPRDARAREAGDAARPRGVWFEHLHVGVEDPFSPARKAHPALVVDDLDALAERLGDITWDDAIPGVRRFYAHDPFGNRIEFLAG